MIPWKEKKDFYSAAAKVACRIGGPSPEGSTDVERKPETMEPANYHGYCAAFWESMLGKRSIIGVIDFTPSAGYLAEACISLKIPYLGFVQTPTAERVVRRYLFKRAWDFMGHHCERGRRTAKPTRLAERARRAQAAARAKRRKILLAGRRGQRQKGQ